jgi:hypothetical protein
MAQPGQPFKCKGVVKASDGNEVQLEIWGEDADGKKTVVGSATLERQ